MKDESNQYALHSFFIVRRVNKQYNIIPYSNALATTYNTPETTQKPCQSQGNTLATTQNTLATTKQCLSNHPEHHSN